MQLCEGTSRFHFTAIRRYSESEYCCCLCECDHMFAEAAFIQQLINLSTLAFGRSMKHLIKIAITIFKSANPTIGLCANAKLISGVSTWMKGVKVRCNGQWALEWYWMRSIRFGRQQIHSWKTNQITEDASPFAVALAFSCFASCPTLHFFGVDAVQCVDRRNGFGN